MSFFPNAHRPIIEGGRFTSVQGDAHFHVGDENARTHRGFDILHRHVAASAFYDAAERIDPPKCHPQTRLAILTDIQEWVRSPEGRKSFFIWLYGPAGSGKSAIAQTIAEIFAQEGLLVASFFFLRNGNGRNDVSKFIASIAYQLSLSIPEIRTPIAAAVEQDPLIFTRTLSSQMQTLIVKPVNDFTSCLTKASTLKHVKPKLIIVDGLDEAREETTQKELLDTLTASFYQLHIPLIFIIASRPEYVIRQAFNIEPLRSLTKGMALDEHYKSDEDIRVFLHLKFKEIKELHPLGKNLPKPWPSENDMKYLVLKSSGQFIFASTVIKYIDSPRHNPARRLKIVLGLSSPGKDTPFAQLDTLYDLILSSVNDISKVLDILALIFLQTGYDIYLTIDFIETLLNLESGDVLTALTDMHALIRIPSMENDDDQLHVYHASLQDFLMDKSRAGRFFLDAQAYHVALAHYLLCYINNAFTSEYKADRLQAVLNGFIDHFLQISESDDIVCCLRNFSLTKFLRIDTFYATKWDAFFHHLQTQCSEANTDLFERLQNEFDTWILARYQQYPELIQCCISAACAIPSSWTVTYLPDIFDILTHGLPSYEAYRLRVLDSNLFLFSGISSLEHVDFNGHSVLRNFFANPVRAGHLLADRAKFGKLAAELVKVLCGRGKDTLPIVVMDRPYLDKLTPSVHSEWYSMLKIDYGNLEFFPRVLAFASEDHFLAELLWNLVVQYKNDSNDVIQEARVNMAIASLEYIKKCGISIPEHAHGAGCQVCATFEPLFIRPGPEEE